MVTITRSVQFYLEYVKCNAVTPWVQYMFTLIIMHQTCRVLWLYLFSDYIICELILKMQALLLGWDLDECTHSTFGVNNE